MLKNCVFLFPVVKKNAREAFPIQLPAKGNPAQKTVSKRRKRGLTTKKEGI